MDRSNAISNTPEPTEPSSWKARRGRVGSFDLREGGFAANALSAFTGAVVSLHERAIDRMLATSERVTSADEARALLASEEDKEAVADRMQRMVVLFVPVVRTLAKGARWTKVPWILVSSSALTTGLTVRTGAREVQVLASLIAHRIEEVSGEPPDPALVKRLAVELYLAPKRAPDVSDRRPRVGRLVRRWVFRGVFGRETGTTATKALRAAERLDVRPLIARWAELGAPPGPPARPDSDPASGRRGRRSTPPS